MKIHAPTLKSGGNADYISGCMFYFADHMRRASHLEKPLTKRQSITPITVGMRAARPVHFQLSVSFRMVSNVVEQGQ